MFSNCSTALSVHFVCSLPGAVASFETTHIKAILVLLLLFTFGSDAILSEPCRAKRPRDILPLLLFSISVRSPGRAPTHKLTPISMVTEADTARSMLPWPRAAQLQRHKLCIIIAAAAWDSMRRDDCQMWFGLTLLETHPQVKQSHIDMNGLIKY